MKPPTLVSMAQRACIRNVAALQDVGEISYQLLRPILKKIDNPEQLRQIELSSPHIADHDAELWRAFIARDILDWKTKLVEPSNPRSWWKVYRKMLNDERRAQEEQEEQLKATMTGIEKKKEENQTHFVSKVIPEDRRQTAFIDGRRNPNVASAAMFGEKVVMKKPALKNAKTGWQIMSALRKQSSLAQKQKGFNQTHPLKIKPRTSQVTRAPESMVRDYTKPVPRPVVANGLIDHEPPAAKVFVSRNAPTARDRAISEALRAEQVKREERLRVLASGAKPAASSPPPLANSRPTNAASARSPPAERPQQQSPTVTSPLESQEPRAALKVAEEATRRLSPSPAPSPMLKRSRPATTSVFMPSKRRKI